jgi:hypothetical protein
MVRERKGFQNLYSNRSIVFRMTYSITELIQVLKNHIFQANSEENYNALCSLGELLEKKDRGNVKHWKAEVKRLEA